MLFSKYRLKQDVRDGFFSMALRLFVAFYFFIQCSMVQAIPIFKTDSTFADYFNRSNSADMIVLEGRDGADDFKDVNHLLEQKRYDLLLARANKLIAGEAKTQTES